ncbi:MAG: PrsW family intramembrane metalloprotease [Deltaproteobacteria bacterium]|nr:PrsW family intramembrane metalloprotease [Deltaproteobacteria bacterium]
MNANVQVALSGVIPALVAMWIVDRLDRKRPEPARTRRLVAFAGMLSVIPAIIIEGQLIEGVAHLIGPPYTYQGASFNAFVVAAAVEEACKIAVVYWIVWRKPELDERMDGIVYASRAGLGFALVENVGYLLNQTTLDGQLYVWVARALLAVPGHAMWTGMIGAMAARRRFDGKGLGLLGGYLLAVAFHGAYDLAVFAQAPLRVEGHAELASMMILIPIALTVLAFFVLRSMARTALRLDDAEAASAAVRAAVNAPPIVAPPAAPR